MGPREREPSSVLWLGLFVEHVDHTGHSSITDSAGGTRQAATLAYYAIFSIFPLTLLFAVLIGRILGPVTAQTQIANALGLFLPADTAVLLKQNITDFKISVFEDDKLLTTNKINFIGPQNY